MVLTIDPVERFCKNESSADCAELTSPEPSAEPICESRLPNRLEELPVVELDDAEVLEPLPKRRLVSES